MNIAETQIKSDLKKRLLRSTRRARRNAFLFVLPLLAFVLLTFAGPIISLLKESIYNPVFADNMTNLTPLLDSWDGVSPPDETMYAALVADLVETRKQRTIGEVATRVNRQFPGVRSLFIGTARSADELQAPFKAALEAEDKTWTDPALWQAMKVAAPRFTTAYLAAAVDARLEATGDYSLVDEDYRIYVTLFIRTFMVGLAVTVACLILGYPLAWVLAHLPPSKANLLMILVLLPFWTSLLVRTTTWIVLLQQQGVINDLLVWAGIISDDNRLAMIYNMTGTLIAMTHILLPFMILPLYSVMKTIAPQYMRAARSLGATGFTAFYRIYLPLTASGIGAGSLLVFILAVGYYITPALVGGQDGQLISNMIAFHMNRSLNWSLAAALGGLLLLSVLLLYWLYDRLVGVDRMKLG